MEKFREIEVDLQNRINEILGIDTLFDDYVKERNDYDKDLFNSLIINNAKLSNKINKAIEYINENKDGTDCCGEIYTNLGEIEIEELLKILKGEENG